MIKKQRRRNWTYDVYTQPEIKKGNILTGVKEGEWKILPTGSDGEVLKLNDGEPVWGSVPGGATQAEYVVVDYHGDLANERKITAGNNMSFTDNGANGTLVIDGPSTFWTDDGQYIYPDAGTSYRILDSATDLSTVSFAANTHYILTPGTYQVSSAITISNNNVTLQGSRGVVIQKTGACDAISVTGNYNKIIGITVNGNSQNNSGIFITGNNNIVSKCYSYDNNSHGIGLDGQATDCWHNLISENICYSNGEIGISQNEATDTRIVNNFTYDNNYEGITIDNQAHRCVVTGNHVSGNGVTGGVGGIGVDYSDLCTISNNIIRDTGSSLPGIRTQNNLGPSNYNTYSGNIILENDSYGIHLKANGANTSDYNIITGNIFRDNDTGGSDVQILIDSGCDENMITGNNINSKTITDNGTNNTICHNDYGDCDPGTLWTDQTTYIDPDTATGEFQIGDSGQVTEPVTCIQKSVTTTGAIGAPTGITGDFIPYGAGGSNLSGGHVGYFNSIVRTDDSSNNNIMPFFNYYYDKDVQNGQSPASSTYAMFDAQENGGSSLTVFARWDICVGPTNNSMTGRVWGNEINVQECRSDKGFLSCLNSDYNDSSVGLAIVTEDTFNSRTGYNCTSALYIAESSHDSNVRWHTGITIKDQALVYNLSYTYYPSQPAHTDIGIAIQLQKDQAIRWCTGDPGTGQGVSHANYYPLIVGDTYTQLYIMLTASYWWRFTNTGALQYSSNAGQTWTSMNKP